MTRKQYVFITGGSGGIGTELCRILADQDLTPIVGFRSDKPVAQKLASDCGGFAVPLDLESNSAVQRALEVTTEKLRDPQTLRAVVLAASPPPDLLMFGKLTETLMLRQFQVNVIGHQRLVAGLIKKFFRKTRTGTIVGILSAALAQDGRPAATSMGSYVIAKTALQGMLSVCESEHPWLKVKSVSPSFTRTKMLDVFDERYLTLVQDQKPISTAREVAESILAEICSG